jgi:hypothetical protein
MAENQVDPRFFLPPNVIDLRYEDINEMSSDAPEQSGDIDVLIVEGDVDITDDFSGEGTDEDRLLPPDYITLVSETVRVTSGGTVVDVVIDVEDIANVSQFEVRKTN